MAAGAPGETRRGKPGKSVAYAGQPVSRRSPGGGLARALLNALGAAGRATAVASERAPNDIRTGTRPHAADGIEPRGVGSTRLGPAPQALLSRLVVLTSAGRLPAELAAREAARIATDELSFAWDGPTTPGTRHYYRVQGNDLLIEYDNTKDDSGNAHSVLRRPRSDFGDDVTGRALPPSPLLTCSHSDL
ncbi:MAG TPA: DUF3500 domain-containing protein [Streptosporangiaceae bacterium]|nr:DUF3500 domain-containing protein [Streptosporangiaceae bacterium]